MKQALITGVKGQDGSYLAEFLIANGYAVSGVDRAGGAGIEGAEIIIGDILSQEFIRELVSQKFDEIYNLASIATVQSPWEDPVGTIACTGLAPLYFLEAIRTLSPSTKFFQASSAEMFGEPEISPQNENTAFNPKSPYGIGKLMSHVSVGQYRREFKLFAVSGILFNHESPRRGERFVTRKITKTLARIKAGTEKELVVGNLSTVRDWGFAGDYVEAMRMMLQANVPEDYVIASGAVHTVRDFVDAVAQELQMPLTWEGEGEEEVGKNAKGNVVARVSKDFFRPVEKIDRCGDVSKIQKVLGWKPKTNFDKLVRMMVEAEK